MRSRLSRSPSPESIVTTEISSSSPFRCLPQGFYTLIPTVFTTVAWMASMFQDGCDYARVSGPIVDELTGIKELPYVEVGFSAYRKPVYDRHDDTWKVEYSGRCIEYNDVVDIDPAWTAAKGFAFLALVLGGGGSLFLWFSVCCVFSKGTWRWAGYEVLLAALFQLLSFSWFATRMCAQHIQTQNQCVLGWGSKANFVGAAFWFVAATSIFFKYPFPKAVLPTDFDEQGLGVDMSPVDASVVIHNTPTKRRQVLAATLPLEGDVTAKMQSPIVTASTNSQLANSNHNRMIDVEVS